jgi:putative transcriptional regulator
MSRHPAPDELLLDYAAGTLTEGPALAVALQAALDPGVRRMVSRLRDLGGALLEEAEVTYSHSPALETVLARLESTPVEAAPTVASPPVGFEWAPPPLVHYLGSEARWKKAFGGFEEIRIPLHGDSHRVSLLRLEPGKGLPMHRHVGSEYTVVLQGGYTDNTGNYGVGDFAVGPGPEQHEPVADPGPSCIALVVVEKPIVMTGAWARLLNPLLRWGWM